MPSSEIQSLRQASAALAESDTKLARIALLEAWRSAHSPQVADLLGLLDARQPDDLPALLGAVLAPRVTTTLERFEPLLRRDDPRVSAFALSCLERLPFTTPGAQPLLWAFLRAVLERKDVRLLPRANAIREGIRTRIGRAAVRDDLISELDRLIGVLEGLKLTSTPAARELHESLRVRLEPLAAPARTQEALLSAIYAQPREDGPRLVYADWLLERGDPRGEFITLQFKRRAGPLSEVEAKREAALLKKHGKAWLGALAPVLSFGKGYSGTTFERGFISTADIILSVGKKLEPLWQADEWRTVERLEGSWPLELLQKAPLTGLSALHHRTLGEGALDALRRGRHQLVAESIQLDASVRDWALVRAVLPKLNAVVVWWNGTPTLEVLRHYAELKLHRLEVHRTWNGPRGAEETAALETLIETMKTTRLPIVELAFMKVRTNDRSRPELLELRLSATGYTPVS